MKQLFLKGMLSLLVLIPSLAFAEMPQSWASKKVFVFPDAGRSPWLDAINNAESSIDMAAYKLSDVEVMEALKKAQKRGVAINLLIEPQVFKHAQSANITSPIEDLKKNGGESLSFV